MDTDQQPNDMNAAEALAWLVEMGADEIMGEVAVDRYSASLIVEKPKPVAAPPPPRTATLPDQSAADATAQAAASGTIEALTQALNYFDANPLRKSATQLSFIEGNLASPILIVGDRPRNEEDKSGQVFAGKSRVLLTAMLAAIEIKVDDVALLNFIPWRPPGNRNASENEIAMCLPFAARAVELIKPKMILSFGAIAGHYLASGDASVLRQRGKWLAVNGIPVMTTFHPDELLKLPAQKKLAWRDLLTFKMKWDDLK